MQPVFKKIIALLLVVGLYSASVSLAQQHTGAVLVPRNRTSPSIHEGLSGIQSAGYKQGINPLIGNLPASYLPFHGFGNAIGSLILPRFHAAPTPPDASSYGFKPTFQTMIEYKYYGKAGVKQFDPGTKGIAGKNVTDTASPGIPGDTGPGGLYWVGYPRPGNIEFPPRYQIIHHPYDCFCRWNETIKCPLPESPFWHLAFGGNFFFPVPCQACFVGRIVKHDFYVGFNKPGVFDGYPFTYPNDTGYQECLKQSTQSYSASGPGGSPVNPYYGL